LVGRNILLSSSGVALISDLSYFYFA